MQNVNIVFNANANFSDLIAEVRRVNAELSNLNTQMLGLDARGRASVLRFNKDFAETLKLSGQFDTSIVTATNDIEKFGRNLDAGRLRLKDYYRAWRTSASSAQGEVRKLAEQQVRLERSIVKQTGVDARGRAVMSVFTPRGLDLSKQEVVSAVNQKQVQIFNEMIKKGSTELINWGKNTQWAGRQLTVGLTVPMTIFAGTAATAFKKADEQLTRLAKVYGDVGGATAQQIEAIKKQSMELAQVLAADLGAPLEQTLGLAADIAATGRMGDDLIKATAETTRLAVLGEVDRQQALETTLSLQNAFNLSTQELTESINFLNAVENQTSTTLQDLTVAIPKAGPVIKSLGGDVKDLALFLSAMVEGGVSAGEAANAIKSGFASLINPTKQTVDVMNGFGISINNIIEGNAGDLVGTIMELKSALDGLDPLSKTRALEQLFGKYQVSRITALFDNIGAAGSQTVEVMKLMEASTTELAATADRELRILTESASGRFNRQMQRLKANLAGIGESFIPIFTVALDLVNRLLEGFNNLPGPIKNVLNVLGGLVALAGPVIMLAGVFGNFFGYLLKGLGFIRRFVTGTKGFQLVTADTIAMQSATDRATAALYNEATAMGVLRSAANTLTAQLAKLVAVQNTVASGSVIGPRRMPNPRRYNRGVLSVPGTGSGDTVPALLTPGEAVIPAKEAKAYRPLIQSMIAGKADIPGFNLGVLGAGLNITKALFRGRMVGAHASEQKFLGRTQALALLSGAERSLLRSNRSAKVIGLDRSLLNIDDAFNQAMKIGGPGVNPLSFAKYLSRQSNLFAKMPEIAALPKSIQQIFQSELVKAIGGVKGPVNDSLFARAYTKAINATKANLSPKDKILFNDAIGQTKQLGQTRLIFAPPRGTKTSQHASTAEAIAAMEKAGLSNSVKSGKPYYYTNKSRKNSAIVWNPDTGRFVSVTTDSTRSIAKSRLLNLNRGGLIPGYKRGVTKVPGPLGKGDVIPAMLTPGESVIPADMTRRYAPLIDAMIKGDIPGYERGKRAPDFWTQELRDQLLNASGAGNTGRVTMYPDLGENALYSLSGIPAPRSVNASPLGMTSGYLQSPLGTSLFMAGIQAELEALGVGSERVNQVLNRIQPTVLGAINKFDDTQATWVNASQEAFDTIARDTDLADDELRAIRRRLAPIADDYPVTSRKALEISRGGTRLRDERSRRYLYRDQRMLDIARQQGIDVSSLDTGYEFAHMPGRDRLLMPSGTSSLPPRATSAAGLRGRPLSGPALILAEQRRIEYEAIKRGEQIVDATTNGLQEGIDRQVSTTTRLLSNSGQNAGRQIITSIGTGLVDRSGNPIYRDIDPEGNQAYRTGTGSSSTIIPMSSMGIPMGPNTQSDVDDFLNSIDDNTESQEEVSRILREQEARERLDAAEQKRLRQARRLQFGGMALGMGGVGAGMMTGNNALLMGSLIGGQILDMVAMNKMMARTGAESGKLATRLGTLRTSATSAWKGLSLIGRIGVGIGLSAFTAAASIAAKAFSDANKISKSFADNLYNNDQILMASGNSLASYADQLRAANTQLSKSQEELKAFRDAVREDPGYKNLIDAIKPQFITSRILGVGLNDQEIIQRLNYEYNLMIATDYKTEDAKEIIAMALRDINRTDLMVQVDFSATKESQAVKKIFDDLQSQITQARGGIFGDITRGLSFQGIKNNASNVLNSMKAAAFNFANTTTASVMSIGGTSFNRVTPPAAAIIEPEIKETIDKKQVAVVKELGIALQDVLSDFTQMYITGGNLNDILEQLDKTFKGINSQNYADGLESVKSIILESNESSLAQDKILSRLIKGAHSYQRLWKIVTLNVAGINSQLIAIADNSNSLNELLSFTQSIPQQINSIFKDYIKSDNQIRKSIEGQQEAIDKQIEALQDRIDKLREEERIEGNLNRLKEIRAGFDEKQRNLMADYIDAITRGDLDAALRTQLSLGDAQREFNDEYAQAQKDIARENEIKRLEDQIELLRKQKEKIVENANATQQAANKNREWADTIKEALMIGIEKSGDLIDSTQELNDLIGKDGVDALKKLAEATKTEYETMANNIIAQYNRIQEGVLKSGFPDDIEDKAIPIINKLRDTIDSINKLNRLEFKDAGTEIQLGMLRSTRRSLTEQLKQLDPKTFNDETIKNLLKGNLPLNVQSNLDNINTQEMNVDAQKVILNVNQPGARPSSQTYKDGGYVVGPGTGTSDSIPARLSAGEYVIKASSVKKYGKNTLDALNFADGGLLDNAGMQDILSNFKAREGKGSPSDLVNAAIMFFPYARATKLVGKALGKMRNLNKKPKNLPEMLGMPTVLGKSPEFSAIEEFIQRPLMAYGSYGDFYRTKITKFLSDYNLKVKLGEKFRALSDKDVEQLSQLKVGDIWYPEVPKSFGHMSDLQRLGAAINPTKREGLIGNWVNSAMARIDVVSDNVQGISSMSKIGRPTGIPGEGIFGPTTGYIINSIPGPNGGSYILTAINMAGKKMGGYIKGYGMGGPTSDSVLARISNGEYIMSANTVKKMGVGFMDRVNSGSLSLPSYAMGGIVNYGKGGYTMKYESGGMVENQSTATYNYSPNITINGANLTEEDVRGIIRDSQKEFVKRVGRWN